MKKSRQSKMLLMSFIIPVVVMLIIMPDIASTGVEKGLMICSNVIIPSLFPFMVCILCLVNYDINFENVILSKIIYKILGQNIEMFSIFIFSMLGGYPIGCKLINEMYLQNKISKKSANFMQMYCVNAGPAFVVTAIGSGYFKSKKIGIVLLVSQLLASFVIAILTAKYTRKGIVKQQVITAKKISIYDNFVLSVSSAAGSVMNICAFVIYFSAINSYFEYLFNGIPILQNIINFTEVTTGIFRTNNVVFASFLIGFAGISIWCQIFSISKDARVNFKLFIIGRLTHGLISSFVTYFLIKTFKVSVTTISNGVLSGKKYFYTDISLSISMFVMITVLLIYIFSKNCSRKIIDDVV